MRTSAATASALVAKTGLRSSSTISWKSLTSCETLTMISANASRLAGAPPRTPLSISWGREEEGDIVKSCDGPTTGAECAQFAEGAVGDGAYDPLGAAGEHLLRLDA